jgi:hypothetical protein
MDAWSRFWRQGHTTTFGDYFEEGYAGPVKDWLESLRSTLGLVEDGSLRVVELCCGNGSLVPFLVSLSHPFVYTGVDAANVSLPSMVRDAATHSQGSVEMLPNTPVEQLPESITGVDCCFSVYGIEYSELQITLSRMRERMSADGRLFALLHHQNSIVARMSRRAVSEFHARDIGLVEDALSTIQGALQRVGSVSALKTDPQSEQARKFMNGMANKYIEGATLKSGNAFMADHVLAALRFFKLLGEKPRVREQFISDLREEANAALERHQQMVAVAKDASDMQNLTTTMAAMGWSEVETQELTDKDDIIGWTLTAKA